MKRIEVIVNEAAAKVKAILIGETRALSHFPQMHIGVKDPKYAETEPNIVDGMLGSVDVRSEGIALLRPGILVYDQDKFWSENQQVIMMPDGLYRFRMSMFLMTQEGHPTNLLASNPDMDTRREEPADYLVYGPRALYLMRDALKRQGV
ncbi:MAG: hypothetical protein WCP89_01055 [archaeon]